MSRARFLLLLACLFVSTSAAFAAGIPIHGRVLDAGGAPLAKAKVRLVPIASVYVAGTAEKKEPTAAVSVESGADGGFLLEAPEPGMWKVVVGGDKLPVQEALADPLTGELDLPAVRLRPGTSRPGPGIPVWGPPAAPAPPGKPPAGEVALRIVSAVDGRPLPGALVWWTKDPGAFRRTDARGEARLAVPAAEPFTVHAAAPGFLLDGLDIRKAGEKPQTARLLSLQPDLALTGVVVDEAGDPVAGVEIAPTVQNRPSLPTPVMMRVFRNRGSMVRSGPGGRFRLGGLIAGVEYELRVTKDGYAPLRVPAVAPLRIVLPRGRSAFGRVLGPDRQPIARAQVSLKTSVPSGPDRFRAALFPENQETFEAVTGADGRFDLLHLPAGRYDLTARGRGWAPLTVPSLEIPDEVPNKSGATDLGTLVLAPGVALEGAVVDTAGKPVDGAEIRLAETVDTSFPFPMPGGEQEPAALSGADGFFRIEDLRSGSRVNLTARRTGYAAAEVKGVQVPAERPVRIALQAVASISGRVVDPDGAPIAGASVEFDTSRIALISTNFQMSSQSDADGNFRIPEVIPGPVSLIAQASGWQTGSVTGLELKSGEEKRGVEIVLSRAAIVRGRVLAPSGRPVPDAQVMLAPEDRRRGASSAITDDEGRYELDTLPPGLRTLEASHPDHGSARRQVEVRVGDNASFDITLESGSEVSGRVIDGTGAPVAGAQVWLGGAESRPLSTVSRSDGGFRFAAVADGIYRAGAVKEGFARPERVTVTVSGSDVSGLELRITRGGALVGRITGVDAAELSRVQIVAWGQGTPLGGGVDPDGAYRIENLQAGDWRVRAELPGTNLYAEGEIRLEPGASEARLDLEMEGGLELSGHVRRNGAPAAGQFISLEGPGRRRSFAETDAEGRFRFAGLAVGTYRLVVEGRPGRHEETVDLQLDREVTIDLAAGEVSGRVVDADDGSPLTGAAVQLVAADSESILGQERTDSRGLFILRNVPEGSLRVRAQADGYASAEAVVHIDGGSSDPVELSLRATEGVTLQVAAAAGLMPRSLFYAVLDRDGRKVGDGTAVVEDGRVRLARVPAGFWQVLLLSETTAATEVAVTSPGDAGHVVLPPPCNLRVRVPALAGTDVPATVSIFGLGGRPFRTFAGMFEPTASWDLRRGVTVVRDLPPGAWEVQVTAADGRTWRATATTTVSAPAEVVLD